MMEIKFLWAGENEKFGYFLLSEGIHELKWFFLCWYSKLKKNNVLKWVWDCIEKFMMLKIVCFPLQYEI